MELLKIILPACITGIITFLITKYSYHTNIPLDKYEASYNRVYYPIYCMILSEKEIQEIVEKSKIYLEKYNKYTDRSTLVAFRYLEANSSLKKAYSNYTNNIYYMNSKLRRRLGYLEPSIINMYTYSAPTEKRVFRMIFELLAGYICLTTISIIKIKILQTFFVAFLIICFGLLVVETIIIIFCFIKNLVKSLWKKLRCR